MHLDNIFFMSLKKKKKTILMHLDKPYICFSYFDFDVKNENQFTKPPKGGQVG